MRFSGGIAILRADRDKILRSSKLSLLPALLTIGVADKNPIFVLRSPLAKLCFAPPNGSLLGGIGAWLIKFYGHALWRNKIYEPPRMGANFEATIAGGICGAGR